MTVEPEDQVPRLSAYQKAHPGITIRMLRGQLPEAEGEFGGEEFVLKTATLERLLDVLEGMERDAAARQHDRLAGERGIMDG